MVLQRIILRRFPDLLQKGTYKKFMETLFPDAHYWALHDPSFQNGDI